MAYNQIFCCLLTLFQLDLVVTVNCISLPIPSTD
jgi:hypothetical protein